MIDKNTNVKITDEAIAFKKPILGDFFLPNGFWFLYVLFLENDCYYVGITLYPQERIDAHFKGIGSNFTKRNKPINVVELYCLNISNRKLSYKNETLKTKEYRIKYGSNKVIGGKYLQLKKS
jgi:predicted GIY-YIG superfamily endonuclease